MKIPLERIPFEEAISEPLLLKKSFDELSVPQQVALKAFYGLPLAGRELDLWSMFQEQGTYDELGYPLTTRPLDYVPKEYQQAWLIFGRRSGKTDKFAGLVLPYEAALGGHMNYVRPGQEVICFLVAQNLTVAKANLSFVRATIQQSPLLAQLVANDTAAGIELKNGILIAPASPSIKAQRGLACPCIAMDEVGFWYKDSESANPDFEVERALSWSQAQFPHFKRFGTTTPWTQEGLAYKHYTSGTEGRKLLPSVDKTEYRDILVLHAPTAAMENPHITRDFLEKERARDLESFERESLAKFTNAISGFLNAETLQRAIAVGVGERTPVAHYHYVGAIDPAFRGDAFTFTIVHHDRALGIVQDYVEEFKPSLGVPLNPQAVLESILPVAQRFGLRTIFADQYQFESLAQLALGMNISLENVDFTGRSKAKIMGSLQHLLNTKRLVLLDPKKNPAAAEMVAQLGALQKRMTSQGNVTISAPSGKHDDLAVVLALACFKAVWLLGEVGAMEESDAVTVPLTHIEMGNATIAKRRDEALRGGGLEDW